MMHCSADMSSEQPERNSAHCASTCAGVLCGLPGSTYNPLHKTDMAKLQSSNIKAEILTKLLLRYI